MTNKGGKLIGMVCLLAALALALGLRTNDRSRAVASPTPRVPSDTLTLDATQARQVRVVAARERDFADTTPASGRIDYDQDQLAQVTSPYAGRVHAVFVKAGDTVKRGQPLFSLDSPDLAQAEGTLIAAAGARDQAQAALKRAEGMAAVQANAPRDLEQARADEQSAEGNDDAARRALTLFGKHDADIERIVRTRHVDAELRIDSPIDGVVSSRNVAPGDLVQPGGTVPFDVAAPANVWVIADVAESDAMKVHLGQPLSASVGDLAWQGRVDYVSSASDAATHRVTVRATFPASSTDVRPGMLVDVSIVTGTPVARVAVPENAVVRESDGTTVVFTTNDARTFTRRPVTLGPPQGGYYPVISGLASSVNVAGDGALFLGNALALRNP